MLDNDAPEGRASSRWLVGACAGAWLALAIPSVHATATAATLSPDDGRVATWLTVSSGEKKLSLEQGPALREGGRRSGHIEVRPEAARQEIVGFGAAMTDSSAFVMQHHMSADQRGQLMRDLFSPEDGIGLNMTRLTIGASDFSSELYSFDDVPAGQADVQLQQFSLGPQRDTVVPATREAISLNPSLKIVASPWSAPAWMKSSDNLIGGSLRPDRYAAFAEYLSRSVAAYEASGIPIFAITVQNEPRFVPSSYPGMWLDPDARRTLLADHIGPLFAARHPRTRILEWDHNWKHFKDVLAVLDDPAARRYVGGVAWHCYEGRAAQQNRVHAAYPDIDAYLTECSGGGWEAPDDDALTDIAGKVIGASLRAWSRGAVLWNLVLDEQAGPRVGGCPNCRPVVTVDSRTGQATRNPEFYALAHFSRFVREGARRLETSAGPHGLTNVAFRNPDGSLVLVVVNHARKSSSFSAGTARCNFTGEMPALSVGTYVWHPTDTCRTQSRQ